MKVRRRCWTSVALGGMLTMLLACGGGDEADDTGTAGGADQGGSDASESCQLLTDEEISDAIGQHGPAEQDMMFGGCIWTADAADSNGFTPAIHAAVLPRDHYESLATVGEPVDGLGESATYDDITGELWFPCRDAEFCGVKAHIAESDSRQQIALRLGKALRGRA